MPEKISSSGLSEMNHPKEETLKSNFLLLAQICSSSLKYFKTPTISPSKILI
jgi:hypothetical protein